LNDGISIGLMPWNCVELGSFREHLADPETRRILIAW
jgi:hypothetical protein